MNKDMARAAILLLVLASLTLVTSRRCCPGNEVFSRVQKRCANSSRIVLNCTKSAYMIDPNEQDEEDFFITDTDMLKLSDGELVEPDSYCVTHLHKLDGTLTKKEVAFVCFPPATDYDTHGDGWGRMVLGVCMFISAIFFLATLAVYAILPEMRDLEGKCLMSAMIALLVSFILLATLQFHGHHLENTTCVTAAFLLYYWMLASFFWLNVVSFNLWMTVVHSGSSWSEKRLFGTYCTYGWGCPMIFLVIALITHHMPGDYVIKPEFGVYSCWFHGNVETWSYFYGPIAVIIACNIGFFVSTAWSLWKAYNSHEVKLQSMRYKCILYSKLFVIMGIAWIFELLSHLLDPNSNSYFWFATDMFNCLQGVLIFIITVVCRRRVLRGLSRHQPCGLSLPKKWAAGVDEESDAVLTDEVVEMSQAQTQTQAQKNVVDT